MPRIKLKLLSPLIPWTKIPNILIDQLLPVLKDTELRLLLVLLRSTIGWNHPERAVILSYRTLMKRTGRGSEAIAGALKSLRLRGLIHTSSSKAPKRLRKAERSPSVSEEQ